MEPGLGGGLAPCFPTGRPHPDVGAQAGSPCAQCRTSDWNTFGILLGRTLGQPGAVGNTRTPEAVLGESHEHCARALLRATDCYDSFSGDPISSLLPYQLRLALRVCNDRRSRYTSHLVSRERSGPGTVTGQFHRVSSLNGRLGHLIASHGSLEVQVKSNGTASRSVWVCLPLASCSSSSLC